ncbi:MAG: glycosyltransferase family 1 protein [Candidatus Schekmanbacteria bacterium]|nr:glycosyltransferase family 1 protein [Candidatus Schekmanbacteria bacterium]
MKILFITHPYPNYVPDLLLHGLRKLLGPDVVDFPRKDCVYDGVLGLGVCPEDQQCPGWFPADDGLIDRTDVWKKAERGHFTHVVCDVRATSVLQNELKELPPRLVLLDGEDTPVAFPPGRYVICRRETDGSDFSIPLPMAIPEELLAWITAYDCLPKTHVVGFLGSTADGRRRAIVERVSARFPDCLFQATAVPLPGSPTPVGRLGRDEYYQKLQMCHVVLSLAGAGFDTFRFWENAACHAVHVAERMPLFIPNDFQDGVHIHRFATLDELERLVERIWDHEEARSQMIEAGRRHLREHHLTSSRASYFLDRIGRAFGGR